MVAVLAAAAVARLLPLFHGQPGGLYPDEASEGIAALRMLADATYRPVFIDENGGREAFFAYLVAAMFHFTGPSITAIRVTSSLVGVAGIAAAWPLLRRFGTGAALAGIAWMAGSPWLMATSALGLRNGLTVPFASFAAVALLIWSDRPARRFAFLAGLAVGAGLWTYQPLKLTPLLVIAWMLWLRRCDRALFDRLWAGRVWLLAGYLVAAAPYIWTAVTDTSSYFGRIAGVSPLNPQMLRGGILTHTLQTLGAFFVAGDPNPRHDVAALPLLLWPLPILAALGLWRLARERRNPTSALVLIGLGVYLLAPLLALEGGAPHFQRILGLAPYLAVLVGVGVVEVVRMAGRVRNAGRPLAVAAAAACAAALILTGVYGWLDFALRPLPDRYAAFDFHSVALAEAGARPRMAVIVNPYDAQTVQFLDGAAVPIFAPGADVPSNLGLAALNLDDLPAAARGSAVVYARDPSGNPAVWVVPPP
jgi:Dolichyl-phosphate-mannose-protein mannosyltransferase